MIVVTETKARNYELQQRNFTQPAGQDRHPYLASLPFARLSSPKPLPSLCLPRVILLSLAAALPNVAQEQRRTMDGLGEGRFHQLRCKLHKGFARGFAKASNKSTAQGNNWNWY